MKHNFALMLFLGLSIALRSQNDNDRLRQLYQEHPLVDNIDSISRDLKSSGKSLELILGKFGMSGYIGLVIWKEGAEYCGMTFLETDNGLKQRRVSSRAVKDILGSRLFSDTCNLCELLDGRKKADISHEIAIYIKRNERFACNELYFLNTSYIPYNTDSCAYDIRLLVRTISLQSPREAGARSNR